jgi:putative transcriptional regulator
MKMKSLKGNFLIASPGLNDPFFSQSVVLLCDHTDQGAFGLVVNKVITDSLRMMLENFDIRKSEVDMPVYFGGPVHPEQGYIIYSPFNGKYGSLKVSEDIGVTSSKELLEDIIAGKGPEQHLFALGFSGWMANQLEDELLTDSWLVAPLHADIIFSKGITERWRSAAKLIGVDFCRFSERSGNA